MDFQIDQAIEILERTPSVLEVLLLGISDEWISNNEGPETWSPYDIMGHLIHGEKTDWIPRMRIILSDNADKNFEPFDRFAQFRDSKGKSLKDLMDEFKKLRAENIAILREKKIRASELSKTGIHPKFGKVTLRQLLAAWVVHDLGHIAQTARVMAKQYKVESGPWIEFLPILTR